MNPHSPMPPSLSNNYLFIPNQNSMGPTRTFLLPLTQQKQHMSKGREPLRAQELESQRHMRACSLLCRLPRSVALINSLLLSEPHLASSQELRCPASSGSARTPWTGYSSQPTPFPRPGSPSAFTGREEAREITLKSIRNVDEEVWRLLLPSLPRTSCKH